MKRAKRKYTRRTKPVVVPEGLTVTDASPVEFKETPKQKIARLENAIVNLGKRLAESQYQNNKIRDAETDLKQQLANRGVEQICKMMEAQATLAEAAARILQPQVF